MENYKPKESLGYWLSRSARLVNSFFENHLKPYKLTPSEFAILSTVHHQIANRASQISDYLKMDRAYVTRHIDKLEKKNLICRSIHVEDRRFTIINLTTKGKKLIPKLIKGSKLTNQQLESLLTAQELKTLKKALIKIGNHHFN